jgi:phosphopantothenoylcysteine decarboxylase/phosphopantothenate--cysteine ligase
MNQSDDPFDSGTPQEHLPQKVIVLGVGGGIAAYKSAMLCSRLAQDGHDVRVAMTQAATHFVGAATFAALSGKPVATDCFDPATWPLGPHIELAQEADLLVIAPATANLLGQFACGLAGDLVSTLFLQVSCPVLLAPAMSNQMWEKPAVKRNVVQLQADGCHFVGPDSGWLSCRQKGAGRMSEPDEIVSAIEQLLAF